MTRIVVETTYDPPFTEEAMAQNHDKVLPCLNQRNVQWIRSLVSGDRRRTVCEFEAPDVESLREAYRRAGVSFDRLWVAEVRAPEPERVLIPVAQD